VLGIFAKITVSHCDSPKSKTADILAAVWQQFGAGITANIIRTAEKGMPESASNSPAVAGLQLGESPRRFSWPF
jgi:hypothetical protein